MDIFEERDFTRGFVAALVLSGSTSLQPKNPDHRRALYGVFDFLSSEADGAKNGSRDWFKSLIRIRNRVAPGDTGAFDQFQTDLRDLQLSLTESPNPSYEDISFTISAPFAQSLLDQLGKDRSHLVKEAVKIFVKGISAANAPVSH